MTAFRAQAGKCYRFRTEPPSHLSFSYTGYQFSKPDIISQLEEEESRVMQEESATETGQGE